MAKNRPLRPGEDKPTPAPGGGGTRKPKKPNVNRPKPKKKGGSGGGAITPPPEPGLTATAPIDPNAPISPFSNSNYGYGGAPYLNTDEGILAAKADPEGYLTYLHGRKGFSMPGTAGGSQPFNQWLMNERYPALMQAWDAASLVNPNLNFVQYMQTMGVPVDAANHQAGPQVPMGTGQAVDTGNPFTSSSGTGIPPLPSPSAPSVPQGKAPIPVNPFNKKKRPNAFKRWNQQQGQVGQPAPGATGPNPTYNPASGAGGSQTNLGLAAMKDREAFLGLSPELRGEKGVDSYSGRWSAWGD